MRQLLLLPLLLSAAACAASAEDQPRTLKAQQELDRYLVGKTAGSPQSCLPTYRRDNMITVDDRTILFRDGANRVYRNDPPGGCPGLDRPGISMVTRTPTGQLCRGDIVQLVDLTTGFSSGSCSFGDFVPYTAARS